MLQKPLFGMFAAVLLVGMLAITACGNGGSNGGNVTPTATIPSGTSTPAATIILEDITVTSSVDAGHTHDVTISGADIENPPDANRTINTTFDDGHRHTLTLIPQDYQTLKDGGVVTVTDSLVTGHTHTYVISK
ncbi:MAG: hypothetical protein WC333_05730 [Dehalococcoidia bacterium]|jgi:hypothetical protein